MSTIKILCRLCALECDKYINIYGDSEDLNIGLDTQIVSCLRIQVCREDILPKIICATCYMKLEKSFEFFQDAHKAQIFLLELYGAGEKNYDNKGCDNNVELQDNLQYDQAEGEECRDFESEEETQIHDDIIQNSNEQFNPPDLSYVIPEVLPAVDDSNVDHLFEEIKDDVNCLNEIIESVKESKKKSRRGKKKDSNTNNGSATPRISQILEGYPWSCTVCEDRIMQTLQDLRDHYKVAHQQPAIYKCVSCDKQYDRYRSFSRHIKLHKNPKKYTCDTCGKSFGQKTTLQSHATVHTTERPHVCHQCGKAFKNFSSLHVHGKMHLPDQSKEKYCCDICQREFSTRHTLETHRKIHTGERDFICDICGKSFIAKGSLDYHILSHTGDKNHVCSTCGKCFKTARLLNKHVSLHTGIKPYQCDVCGKQFRERGALREHSRIHTGAMPYSCEFCGKSFRFKGILTVHRRQHTGERPYSCLECRRFFTNWANYNKHMKRMHNCDTSNPENSRIRSNNASNASIQQGDAALNKSIVNEEKINQFTINPVNTTQIYVTSSIEQLVGTGNS